MKMQRFHGRRICFVLPSFPGKGWDRVGFSTKKIAAFHAILPSAGPSPNPSLGGRGIRKSHLRVPWERLVILLLLEILLLLAFAPAVAHADAASANATDIGEQLLARFNCTACHRADDATLERLDPVAAPRLNTVNHRLSVAELAAFIADPVKVKSASRMPHVLGDAKDGKTSLAIAHYLASLPQDEHPALREKGDIQRGRLLYHSVGCVACHAPEAGYRPPGLDESIELAAPSSSQPIALAMHYDPAGLANFLLNPVKVRPSGRMPSMKLTAQEAVDLAAYLQRDMKREDSSGIKPDVALIEAGRAAFVTHRCINCHETGDDQIKANVNPLPELKALRTDELRGCLSAKPVKNNVPVYAISDSQRQAIRKTLRALSDAKPLTADQRVSRALHVFNCIACHDRNGQGVVDAARATYFQSTTEALGDEGRMPPPLTNIGAKLTEKWLRMTLTGEGGSGEMRPHLLTRMPLFGKANVEHLIADLPAADPADAKIKIDVTGGLLHQRGFIGKTLMGNKGLNCITCHGLKGEKALGPPAMDLSFTTQRLQPQWFKMMLLDPQAMRSRTIMPAFFADGKSPVTAMLSNKDAHKQIEQIWIYLKELDQSPLPDGMAAESFVLKPKEKPIVFRTFMEGAGMQAIAVGYPQQIHAAFDARQVRWAIAWRGEFIDAQATWIDRYSPPTKPLSQDVHKLPVLVPLTVLKSANDPWPKAMGKEAGYEFQGYRFDKARVPTMLYTVHGVKVSDRLMPQADGKSFARRLEIENPPADFFYHGSDGKIVPVKARDGKAIIEEVISW